MLILKEPIRLKSLSPLIMPDGFLDRMEGNYKLMQAKYREEELFYLLHQTPEVYVEENVMTTLVVNNQNQTRQKISLEMIHNLFNRLMMAGTDRFTYQDAVFVQSMLTKLGVRNVSRFMKQLYEMQKDSRQVSQLSDLYETYMQSVRTIIQNAKKYSEEEKQDMQGDETPAAPLYWMHDEIFKRLQTGNVYHTIAAFQKDAVHKFTRIRNQETKIAKHSRVSAVLKLRMLENGILSEGGPLSDAGMDIYEKGMDREIYSRDEMINQLAFAVLLNISDQLYQLRCGQIQKNHRFWFQFEGNFRQIMEHTWEQFQAYHLQGKSGERICAGRQGQKREAEDAEYVNALTAAKRQINQITGSGENMTVEELNQISRAQVQQEQEESPAQKEEHARILRRQVYKMNEENRKKWQEENSFSEQLQKNKPVRFDQERTRKETLLLLEHPEKAEYYLDNKTEKAKLPQLRQNTEKTVRQVQTERIAVKHQVHTQEDHLFKQNTENFSEVLQRGIQRQMDRISDQVYRKLEKKLADERKRRGY